MQCTSFFSFCSSIAGLPLADSSVQPQVASLQPGEFNQLLCQAANKKKALYCFGQLAAAAAEQPTKAAVSTQPLLQSSTSVTSQPLLRALQSAYNFGVGSVAGALGATAVYPVDLVKTRLQHQRNTAGAPQLYAGFRDCFRKVLAGEGLLGLYRGIVPQLVGVAPEKAIKLAMNDLMRSLLRGSDFSMQLSIWKECLAGAAAGASQVIFTNPLEIVKIRLQVQGLAAGSKQGAWQIVQNLGPLGLYRGAAACLLRDVPFSAIYFSSYSRLKRHVFGESNGHQLTSGELFLAGAGAGVPAAFMVTPADVIKTRLQVEARSGQIVYAGIRHAFICIIRQEGASALFKGGLSRIMRSCPQFGVTLVAYELIKRWLAIDFSQLASKK